MSVDPGSTRRVAWPCWFWSPRPATPLVRVSSGWVAVAPAMVTLLAPPVTRMPWAVVLVWLIVTGPSARIVIPDLVMSRFPEAVYVPAAMVSTDPSVAALRAAAHAALMVPVVGRFIGVGADAAGLVMSPAARA